MTTGIHWYAEQFSGRSKCSVLSVSNPVLRPSAFLLHGQQHNFEWALVCSHVTIQRSSTITNLVLKATEHNKKRNGKIKLDLCCMKRFPCASTNIKFVSGVEEELLGLTYSLFLHIFQDLFIIHF